MATVVILPTYREAENLPTLIPAILRAAPVTILVVDDGSDDGTREIARDFEERTGRVRLLARQAKTGLGDAYRHGMRFAIDQGADVIGTMDADWSHNPDILPQLIAAIDRGADLAIGSRYIPGGGVSNWPLWRRFLSSSAKFMARAVIGRFCSDFTSGYRLYRRSALERVPPESVKSNSYSFLMEMATLIHRAGLTIREVPLQFVDRRGGVSKMPPDEMFRAVVTLIRLKLQ